MEFRNSVKAVILREGRLLVLRNRDGTDDWYTLPGGGQNPGETLAGALVRECQEEIAATVEVGALRFVRDYIGQNHEFSESDGDLHQVEFIFACEVEEGYTARAGHEPDPGQVEVCWLEVRELHNLPLYPQILKALLMEPDPPRSATYLGDVN